MAYRSNLLPTRGVSVRSFARGLGWFSIGLGVAELLMARRVGRAAGLPERSGLLRLYGAREIGTGIGILSAKHPNTLAPWIWARVAGDVLDIATAASGFGRRSPYKGRAALTVLTLAAVTMVDAVCARELTAASQRAARRRQARDYSDRSGFPRGAEEMRGIAREGAPAQRGRRKPQEPTQPRLSS